MYLLITSLGAIFTHVVGVRDMILYLMTYRLFVSVQKGKFFIGITTLVLFLLTYLGVKYAVFSFSGAAISITCNGQKLYLKFYDQFLSSWVPVVKTAALILATFAGNVENVCNL